MIGTHNASKSGGTRKPALEVHVKKGFLEGLSKKEGIVLDNKWGFPSLIQIAFNGKKTLS